jgi:hypothetical protein
MGLGMGARGRPFALPRPAGSAAALRARRAGRPGPRLNPPSPQELQERLHRGGPEWREEITGELEATVAAVPWRRLCQQVLPLAGEAELLGVLRVLGARHYGRGSGRTLRDWARGSGGSGQGGGGSGGRAHKGGGGANGGGSGGVTIAGGGCAAAGGEAEDAPLVLAGVEWRDVRDALLANALACKGAALARLLAADDAAAPQVERLARLAARLHGDGMTQGQQVGRASAAARRAARAVPS